jgi:hypothetical protein
MDISMIGWDDMHICRAGINEKGDIRQQDSSRPFSDQQTRTM